MNKVDINFAYYLIENFHLYSSYLLNLEDKERLSKLTNILIKVAFTQSFVIIPRDYFNETGVRPTHKDVKLCFMENIEKVFINIIILYYNFYNYYIIYYKMSRFSNIYQMIF